MRKETGLSSMSPNKKNINISIMSIKNYSKAITEELSFSPPGLKHPDRLLPLGLRVAEI
jgi:hypothetical protein